MVKLLKEVFDVEKIQYEVQGKDVTFRKIGEKIAKLEQREKQLKMENKELKKEV